jgi:hypothetical protein
LCFWAHSGRDDLDRPGLVLRAKQTARVAPTAIESPPSNLPVSPSLQIRGLNGEKSLALEMGAEEAKFLRHFKGYSSIGNVGVRSLRGQPASPAFGDSLQLGPHRPGSPGFSRFRLCLQATGLSIPGVKSPKVSGPDCGNSRFAEIIGGDRFDHDCRLMAQSVSTTDKLWSNFLPRCGSRMDRRRAGRAA